MLQASSFRGKPVYCEATGKLLGKVEDVLIDYAAASLCGFIISSGGLFKRSRLVEWQQIRSISKRGITVESTQAAPHISAKKIGQQYGRWLGVPVCDAGGRDWGTLADVTIAEGSGKLRGVCVSGGLVADWAGGWQYLPWSQIEGIDLKNKRIQATEGVPRL